MNKVLIVLMFILLGTSLIVVSNMGKDVQNSFTIEYQHNKNEGLPDIEGKQELVSGVYRISDIYGITLDYNIINGVYSLNGQPELGFFITLFNVQQNKEYTITYKYIDGTINTTETISLVLLFRTPSIGYINLTQTNYQNDMIVTTTTTTQDLYRLYIPSSSNTYNNFRFQIQMEQGSQATSYVVPKLIPVYKDNLTQQEKNEIGIGAFGGISKILKTINDIIKPVGDFINGLLNMF